MTKADRSQLLAKQEGRLAFSDAERKAPTLRVDSSRTFQTIDGFGFSLTGASAKLIAGLDPATREKLLRELFSTDEGAIGTSFLRLSIGASDLTDHSFSLDDLPAGQSDRSLEHFDARASDPEVFSVLKEILAINPDIKLIASPWSAPPWMKDNQSFIGGKLRREYYRTYAEYLVKYLCAMRDEGITIAALTLQNEPLNGKNEPSMVMEAKEQAELIKRLGPALERAGLGTEIFCWDHNCDVPEYPLTVLKDRRARKRTKGVAWHLYGGSPEAMAKVHHKYPKLKVYLTEQWTEAGGHFGGDLGWHIRNVLVGSVRNWSQAVLEWNLASDPDCRLRTPGGALNCLGAITIGDEIERNVSYYIIAHAAKFVRPGSVRIASEMAGDLPNVAFKTKEGQIVLIVLNDSQERRALEVEFNGKRMTTALDAGAVGTYTWAEHAPLC